MKPQVEWFLVTRWMSGWESCDFSIGMAPCYYPMTHGNGGHWVLGSHNFQHPISPLILTLVMGLVLDLCPPVPTGWNNQCSRIHITS